MTATLTPSTRFESSCDAREMDATSIDCQPADGMPIGGILAFLATDSEAQLHFLEESRFLGADFDANHGVNALPVKRIAAVQLEQVDIK